MRSDPARTLAEALGRRGLSSPARLLADAHRPLGPLLADQGTAIGPLTRLVAGDRAGGTAALLEDPNALDRLVGAIDEIEERDAQPG